MFYIEIIIHFRSNGGTDSPDNLLTLCSSCHDKLYQSATAESDSQKLSSKIKKRSTLDVSTIGAYLKRELVFSKTFEYETKYKREILGLSKTHYNDAICASLLEHQNIKLSKWRLQTTLRIKVRKRHPNE